MLRVLGGLELEGHTFHRLKPLLLLAYLALEGPKARRHLAQLFWPRAQDPLNSLSVALNQLKPTGAIEGNEILRARVSTDLEALRQALREGQLEEARRLYRGTFLEGVELPLGEELEEWVWSTRERVALEVHRAFAAQARAFYLLGLPERGKVLLEEAQALPGVAFALEGAEEEFHPPSPLPKEARKVFWGLFFRPREAVEALGVSVSTLERIQEAGLIREGGRAMRLVGFPQASRPLDPQLHQSFPLEAQEAALALARHLPLQEALPLYLVSRPLWEEEDRKRAGVAILQEARALLSENPGLALDLLHVLPGEPEALLLKARALERLGRYREALEALEALETQGSGSTHPRSETAAVRGGILFRLGQVEEALKEAALAREGSPWAQGEALNLEGLAAISRGEFARAADLFARAAVRFLAAGEVARQVDALNNRAVALFEMGSPQAEEVLMEALEAAGDTPLLRARVLLNLGVVRERQGRPEEAEVLYQQALGLAEEAGVLEAMGRAWNNLGALYHRQGRREEAEAAYQKALRLAKEGRDWVLTAAVLANLAELRQDPATLEEAIALLEEAQYTVLAERYRKHLGAFTQR
ncbi:tetratricopeptide repeat protein [Thermus sp. PS18]|uniref:tetratricopeptide repeat protein n=1 Tax=Thermus sp. PS18 TaxID=2849039 RepID=UPI0022653516|nr:tetratricopeptide repeat protein [Thermus sp. PS18]UZX14841.1 tetratricopeptide repeat protein [Thermus sp. PS18]